MKMKTMIYCLIIGLLLVPPVFAEIFNVTISTQLTPEYDTDPVFGFSAPFPVTFTMQINTDFDVVLPSSAWVGPDIYGYQADGITMAPFVVGTASFSKSGISELIAIPGYSASIWFDAPLSHDIPPENMWLQIENNDVPYDSLSFGTIVCGASDCWFEQNASAYDGDLGNSTSDSPFTFQVTRADNLQSIPTLSEWGMIVMSLILAGSALWMIRRCQMS